MKESSPTPSAGLMAYRKLLFTASLPELGPGPRADALPADRVNALVDRFVADQKPPAGAGELLRGAALLWHDHHEAAHALAQADEGRDGSFLHAILHRREPDAGNAKYWFHRVGRHAGFPQIAERVRALSLSAAQKAEAESWIGTGEWDPAAFVDACEVARRRGTGDAQYEFFRQVQQIEFEALVEHLLGRR